MRPLPIAKHEFLQAFRRCTPPPGFEETIAVANSGGPDSTCLLFLIHRYIRNDNAEQALPKNVVSLTVDHGLQNSSHAMAQLCAKTAAYLGITHVTTPIPWSHPPFPPIPAEGESFEGIARDARHQVLFHAMTHAGVRILAFGHHADDQVETALMRLGRQTSEFGAGGMRRCRRWGMGSGNGTGSLGWAGYEGMDRWIIRPLLEFGKDRILATCYENGLEYVEDPTNFQPELTLRNALRYMLANGGHLPGPEAGSTKPIPVEIIEQLKEIKRATEMKGVDMDISGGPEQLRIIVKGFSARVEDIDSQVDSHLNRCALPSFPGTFLLSSRSIAGINDYTVRAGMVLRVMRYVSFHPWGSLRADGNRRKGSIQQIVQKVWQPDPWKAKIKAFTAGAGVWWQPVIIGATGKIKVVRVSPEEIELGERTAWMATRQPPTSAEAPEKGSSSQLYLNVTHVLAKKLASSQRSGEWTGEVLTLYDCRFLVRFDIAMMPKEIVDSIVGPGQNGKIVVVPGSRWFLPTVWWQRPGRPDEHLYSEMVEESRYETLRRLDKKVEDLSWTEGRPGSEIESLGPRWIRVECARTLKAI